MTDIEREIGKNADFNRLCVSPRQFCADDVLAARKQRGGLESDNLACMIRFVQVIAP